MAGFDNEVLNAINWDFRGVVPVVAQVTTAGQLPIGTGGSPAIEVGTITSTGSTLTVTYDSPNINLETGSALASSYTCDSGSAVPADGVLTVIGSGGTTTSGSGSTITIVGSSEQIITITSLDNGDTPYTILSTDYYLSCDMSLGVLTVKLPDGPTTGKVYIIKDSSGDASTSNLTVTTVSGAVTIDGATSFSMNTDYEAISVVFNGTSYEVW